MYMVPSTRGSSPRSHHRRKCLPHLENSSSFITSPGTEPSSSELKELLPKIKKRKKRKILYKQNAKDVREDFVYDRHPNTQRVDLEDGYVELIRER